MPTLMTTNLNQRTVCIIQPNKFTYSETFIRAHIERLPAKVRALHNGTGYYMEDDKSFLSSAPVNRVMRATLCRLLGRSPEHFQAQAFKRFLLENKVDVVLAEYGTTGLCVMDACLETGIPFIVHFHGFDAYYDPILKQYGEAYRRMFAEAYAVIAVSHDMEHQLIALGAPREKLFYNPYGVDMSLFLKAAPASASPVFVAVGRFVDKKAPHLTLLAFKKVLEVCPEARLVMIGDGQLWEACKQLTQALRMADAVDFLGARPHAEVMATMQGATAFVQHSIRPSHGDSEGTPVAVLEAGAASLPVVSTRHAGIKDVVIHGETGFLVDERDIDGMAEYMIKLSKDTKLASTLGKRAREHICNNFSMDRSIARLWQIIEGAICGGNRNKDAATYTVD